MVDGFQQSMMVRPAHPFQRGQFDGLTGLPMSTTVNRTVRYDWLAQHLLESLDEIQDFATGWLWTYNHERPNMGLGGITPKQKLALAA